MKDPIGWKSIVYLSEYPPPVAIAIALSSDPGKFFADIILRKEHFERISKEALSILLSRLIIESPVFEESSELGMAFLKLLFVYAGDPDISSYLKILLEGEDILMSIIKVLPWYSLTLNHDNNGVYKLTRRHYYGSNLYLDAPDKGELDRLFVDVALRNSSCQIVLQDGEYIVRDK